MGKRKRELARYKRARELAHATEAEKLVSKGVLTPKSTKHSWPPPVKGKIMFTLRYGNRPVYVIDKTKGADDVA